MIVLVLASSVDPDEIPHYLALSSGTSLFARDFLYKKLNHGITTRAYVCMKISEYPPPPEEKAIPRHTNSFPASPRAYNSQMFIVSIIAGV